MGLWNRITSLLLGNANAALDKIENPQMMLDQYLSNMEGEIKVAEKALVKQMAFTLLLKTDLDKAISQVLVHESTAVEALRQGKEQVAELSLSYKIKSDAIVNQLTAQYNDAQAQTSEFRENVAGMKMQYDLKLGERKSLIARYGYAKALKQMQTTVSKFDSSSAINNFERMAGRIALVEAEARSQAEYSRSTGALEKEVKMLSTNLAVQKELELLKAKLQTA